MRALCMLSLISASLFTSCAIIRPGEVGVRSSFGKLKGEVKTSGMIVYNAFATKVIKIPTRTINRELNINLPSKEGLTIQSDISILYHIKGEKAKELIQNIGLEYDQIITSVFRSAAADVCARYFAKDMHSGERDKIEKEICAKMNENLRPRGFEIESVLLKSIVLPAGLAKAVESKLEAEQQAQQMDFVLMRERKEAERKKVEAEGTRDAQLILSEGLTDQILQLRNIEMMRELIKSNNTKVIITDGKTPAFIDAK
ncbi:MAG: prohibitin family protein [Flavobacteriales bacterium]|nr:prohibitin family protein [Flavobacteriales bacterium]